MVGSLDDRVQQVHTFELRAIALEDGIERAFVPGEVRITLAMTQDTRPLIEKLVEARFSNALTGLTLLGHVGHMAVIEHKMEYK